MIKNDTPLLPPPKKIPNNKNETKQKTKTKNQITLNQK